MADNPAPPLAGGAVPAGEPAQAKRLPSSVLFMCGQNVIRSPIAEALAKKALPASVFVASAGVKTGERDPFVSAVLAEAGLAVVRDSRLLEDLEDDYFDLIITLSPEAHHAALELTRSLAVEVEYWPTADPSGATGTREQVMAAYRDVRDRLAERIRRRFAGAEQPGSQTARDAL